MRKILILAILAVAVSLLAAPVFGQCASALSYTNSATAGTHWTGYTGSPAAGDIKGVSLVIGKGNFAVGAGTDSSVYPMTASGCASSANCQARISGGNFIVNASTAQGSNAWDACPVSGAGNDNLTVIMWENFGETTAAHSGKFVAGTAAWGTTNWAFSNAMTPQNNKVFQTIPKVDIVSSSTVDATHRTFNLRIPLPAEFPTQTNTAFKRQYYTTTIVTPPVVVTGWRLYWSQNASAPTTGLGWNYLATVAIPDDANAYVDYTAVNFAMGSNPTYWAVTPQFADGFYPFNAYTGGKAYTGFFVGQNSNATNPTASPVFANVTADATSVSWTSGVETRVASYQVYWAPSVTDTFKPVGGSIAARGDNQTYNTPIRVLTTATSFYVKVRANKTDGTFEYSAPVQVKRVKGGTVGGDTPISTKPIRTK